MRLYVDFHVFWHVKKFGFGLRKPIKTFLSVVWPHDGVHLINSQENQLKSENKFDMSPQYHPKSERKLRSSKLHGM